MRKTSLVLAVPLAVAGICIMLWPVFTGTQASEQCRNCRTGVLG